MSAFRKKNGTVPYNQDMFKNADNTPIECKPTLIRNNMHVMTFILLLSNIDQNVKQAVNKPLEKRKYAILTYGAAITPQKVYRFNYLKQEYIVDKTVVTISNVKK